MAGNAQQISSLRLSQRRQQQKLVLLTRFLSSNHRPCKAGNWRCYHHVFQGSLDLARQSPSSLVSLDGQTDSKVTSCGLLSKQEEEIDPATVPHVRSSLSVPITESRAERQVFCCVVVFVNACQLNLWSRERNSSTCCQKDS